MCFEEEVRRFIIGCGYADVMDYVPSLSLPFPVCFVPQKKIAVHCIPFPEASIANELCYMFQHLTLEAKEAGIRLVHLHEDVWHRTKVIASSRLKVLLGVFTRVHARKTVVVRLAKPEAAAFLNQHHLQGSPKVRYKYGLVFDGDLVAVATFSSVRPMQRNELTYSSYELVRYACKSGVVVAGGLGKLVEHFKRDVQPDDIMTYVDLDWGWGSSYEQLGFTYIGIIPPQEFWLSPVLFERYYPHKLPVEFENTDSLTDLGYVRIFNAGSAKYLLLLK